MTNLISTWSKNTADEDGMTDEHAWIWREMIGCIPQNDLRAAKVFDVGCNQGGFLRMLYDTSPFGVGVGVDIAEDRVALANAAKGDRPIRYLASTRLQDAGDGFDLGFSHEVIYLIEDLAAHAQKVVSMLKVGGHYDAVTCCHADNPLYTDHWRPRIQQFSNIPVPNHSVEDIVQAFSSAGLQVSVSRFLASAFVPIGAPSGFLKNAHDRMETYTRWKLCFRCTKVGPA